MRDDAVIVIIVIHTFTTIGFGLAMNIIFPGSLNSLLLTIYHIKIFFYSIAIPVPWLFIFYFGIILLTVIFIDKFIQKKGMINSL